MRIGAESFHLGTDGSRLTVAGGPAQLPDATITMPPETFYRLMAGETTLASASKQSTVDGDVDTARLALDTLHGALAAAS
jgi:hypothetical protein